VHIWRSCSLGLGIGSPLQPMRREPAMRDPVLTAARLSFFKKIPQPREFNDVVRRQKRANHIRLRHGVNFIQLTLRLGCNKNFRMHSSRVPSMIM